MEFDSLRLVALDTDGVLFNDTYSPVIERFVTRHGGRYTPELERAVWGSPQLAAGQFMALECKLPCSAQEVMTEFFQERDRYLQEHPVEVTPGTEGLLELLRSTGVRVTSYGGRERSYSFDRFLGHLAGYFDAETPYVDVNPFRPGVKEIVTDVFGYRYDQVLFVDDINRVAEVTKALGAGFVGVPASMPHNFQRAQMAETGVRHTVGKLDEITLDVLRDVDRRLGDGTLWDLSR
ncbi:HAD family phosphatase [Streptomyces solaniscabiei]|uniref:HAD family phosphatase n=1 Tax=Streptomyces solaniscabiei TaxID=2683255 RepID=UPI001CE2CF97|nr:HAD family phosphatase [Streptomyces solaniscabiei]